MPKRTALLLGKVVTIALFFLCSFLFISRNYSVLAQEDNSYEIKTGETLTQPKERVVKVTASVIDLTPPSIPILIAPPNGSLLSDSTPSFIWKESTDAFGIKKYTFTLDGTELYPSIPITATENDDFILTYDTITGYYTITPKNAISDGAHTWKITAVDSYNNIASSVTWSFTIDSQSPVFVITKVDTQTQSISAQDTSTVPTTPIELTANEPIISGTGEAKSTVTVQVRTSSTTLATYTFTIADDGTWQIQLGVLPRDEIVYLDFKIIDQVDHVSILENVPLILKTPKVVIPPIPFLPPPEKPIEIPIPPPKEVIKDVITQITPPPALVQLMGVFPILNATPKPVGQFSIWSIIVVGIISTLPVIKTLLLAGKFGSNFSVASLVEIWRIIGLLPSRKPQGIVIVQSTQEPVGFATIHISGKLDSYRHATHTRLTDANGIYFTGDLEAGTYQIAVTHPDILFPTLTHKPSHLPENQYYQGQEFTITETVSEPSLVIPVDHISQKSSVYSHISHWILTQKMSTISILGLSIIATVLATSYINIAATIFYSVTLVVVHRRLWKSVLHGSLVTVAKQPVHNAVIFSYTDELTLSEVIQTTKAGEFTLQPHKKQFRFSVIDFGYSVIEPLPQPSSSKNMVVIDTTTQSKSLVLVVAASH